MAFKKSIELFINQRKRGYFTINYCLLLKFRFREIVTQIVEHAMAYNQMNAVHVLLLDSLII